MLYNIIGFSWDEGNYTKCQKHGVSLEEIEALFQTKPLLFADIKHSFQEERFFAIGKSCKGRHVFAVFTLIKTQTGNRIRPLSVRYMHQKEIVRYEKEITNLSER
jgi:uncharacterized DUF497 family protein